MIMTWPTIVEVEATLLKENKTEWYPAVVNKSSEEKIDNQEEEILINRKSSKFKTTQKISQHHKDTDKKSSKEIIIFRVRHMTIEEQMIEHTRGTKDKNKEIVRRLSEMIEREASLVARKALNSHLELIKFWH
jgi:hypothetical protein